MSKRFFPQQNGDRKKAKLDVSITDHNFPLSQNAGSSKDNWGDDNDDEILLLASQACEEVYNNEVSLLPDYTICMQPGSTSRQLFDGPSSSNASFSFKKPTALSTNISTSINKVNCKRISSPLPGISSKLASVNNDFDDDLFNDKVYKQDPDYIYKQLLQLREENAKLKSEHGKLSEKCITKEGEASILRSQLKTCQMAVDNARLERVKAQEKVQIEWNDKLTTANSQMNDLRTQLDFKNLEIISIKEKCRMLESSKVRLTQVTVPANDISSSQRKSFGPNESVAYTKRVKTSCCGIQTDGKVHFLKLNKTLIPEQNPLTSVLPLILEPTSDQHSLLQYNEKLQSSDLTQNRCRVYSTYHRGPSTPVPKEFVGSKVTLNSVCDDLMWIASGTGDVDQRCFNVLKVTRSALVEVQLELEVISQKMTTAFQKDMDERYMEISSSYCTFEETSLLSGRALFKEEQAILARRLVTILLYVMRASKRIELIRQFEELPQENAGPSSKFMDVLGRICVLLDNTSCAPHYSGLLLSITHLLPHIEQARTTEIIKTILSSRPMPCVTCTLLELMRIMSVRQGFVGTFCNKTSSGNLKVDHDQGVLLYKKDSCYLQLALKQVEASLKCMDKQCLYGPALVCARNLMGLYSNVDDGRFVLNQDKSRCDCILVLVQVMVYALRICAGLMNNTKEVTAVSELRSICLSGIQVLYRCSLRNLDLSSQLAHAEGHLMEFCHQVKELAAVYTHYANMLSELAGTFHSSPEDVTSSFHRQPWIKSLDTFSLID